jgi:hypothetical protein
VGLLTVGIRPGEAGAAGELDAPWARVYVDGREVGVTPFSRQPIPVGRRRIEARYPDGRRAFKVVEVAPDRLHTVWFDR